MDVDTGTALTFALSGIWAQMRLESKTNCFSVAKLLLLKESSCHYQKSSFPGSILSFFFFPVDCSSRNLKICGRDVQGTKICYWVFSFRYWTACLLTLTREGEYLSAQLLYSVVKQQLGMLVCMPVESYYMYICVLNERYWIYLNFNLTCYLGRKWEFKSICKLFHSDETRLKKIFFSWVTGLISYWFKEILLNKLLR